jgi:hypothetical protein
MDGLDLKQDLFGLDARGLIRHHIQLPPMPARHILARGIAQLMIESAAMQAQACVAAVNKARVVVGSDLPVWGILAI